jgi:preprotein translocase subunit SecG
MYAVLLAVHLLVCLGLIAVVLVQSGKGGGLAGGAFGGSAQTVFGGRGATDFITRATMVLGGLFFATSLVLALMSSGIGPSRGRSLIQEEARRGAQTAPAPVTTPGTQPPAGGQTPAPAGGQTPSGGGTTTPPPGGNR